MKLLKSPAIMASGISTIISSSDSNELCHRIKFLLQEKQAGINSNIINDEIVAIVDNLLEYKCISKKQHKQFLIRCNLLKLLVELNGYLFFFNSGMFKLSERYELIRNILKCDYIRYSPSEISTRNIANSQTYINIPREDIVISLLNSYLQ